MGDKVEKLMVSGLLAEILSNYNSTLSVILLSGSNQGLCLERDFPRINKSKIIRKVTIRIRKKDKN